MVSLEIWASHDLLGVTDLSSSLNLPCILLSALPAPLSMLYLCYVKTAVDISLNSGKLQYRLDFLPLVELSDEDWRRTECPPILPILWREKRKSGSYASFYFIREGRPWFNVTCPYVVSKSNKSQKKS